VFIEAKDDGGGGDNWTAGKKCQPTKCWLSNGKIAQIFNNIRLS